MAKRKPKKYHCAMCGWEGNPSGAHKVKFPCMTFLVCKCGGRLKERQEWLDWNKQKLEVFMSYLKEREQRD